MPVGEDHIERACGHGSSTFGSLDELTEARWSPATPVWNPYGKPKSRFIRLWIGSCHNTTKLILLGERRSLA